MTSFLLPVKLTEAQVVAAMKSLGTTDRQRAVDYLVRQMLAPKPFTKRAVLQAADGAGPWRRQRGR